MTQGEAKRTGDASEVLRPRCGAPATGGWALALACAAVIVFQVWTVRSTAESWKFGREQRDYYNLLIDGWLAGQLHLKVEVPEALRRLENPYDPAARPPGLALHDASFYRGKYYLYFGAAPVVTLMLPFRVATGVDLPLPVAVLMFVAASFLASVALLRALCRRYFATAPAWAMPVLALVLGSAALGPLLLRRPHMWELPIAAGCCFAMLTLGAVWRGLHAGTVRGRSLALAAAGLCLGLAVASRPTYLFATPLLLAPLAWVAVGERRLPWREALAAGVPLALVGAAMAWHNHARFGDPLQFGQAYQLSLDYESKLPHFHPVYVPYNVGLHFFHAAEWSRYFPFISPGDLGAGPPGYTPHRGDVYGIFANLPFAWLAFAAPLVLWNRTPDDRRRLGAWLAATGLLFAAGATVMLLFFSALARYQLDFVPALTVLAGGGLLALVRWTGERRSAGWRVGLGVVAVSAAAWSCGFAVLYSLQFDGLFAEQNPTLRRAVARGLNQLPAVIERVAGVAYGPVELHVRLPERPEGDEDVIAYAGATRSGRVFVRYEPGGRFRVGVEDGDAPPRVSESLEPGPGRSVRLRVALGSLYPPAEHPFFGGMDDERMRALRRRLRVEIDGRRVLDGYLRFMPAETLRLGSAAGFRGEVESVRRVEVPLDAAGHPEWRGHVELQVDFPSDRTGRREPLVVTGRTGAGDLLYVEYLAPERIRIGFDHWGAPGTASEPLAVSAGSMHRLGITLGSLATVRDATGVPAEKAGRLVVTLDGAVVLERDTVFFVAEPGEVQIGRNVIGGTSCEERFTGRIERVPGAN